MKFPYWNTERQQVLEEAKEAVKRLLEVDPGVKAVVSSGYADDPIMADYRDYGFSAVVAKPYDAGEIIRILGELLEDKE